ncbi:hypothetical protein [Nocardioides zhouii]|uniref:Uncharacterized protein n=1 Tax=Nocardioides zhouii TaxID=1168729 RepID=A0A4Q2SSY9_9ACTN|nr:hypothetical protein [Nocardioides zhouii]RYC07470.1 hypothetical protein EUA94_14360 [Nocardioides zhouii]
MSQPTEQRPPQVTLASSIIMFASVIVLLTAFERVSTLGSLETQQSIRDVLAESPFSSLGLDLEGATQLLRIGALVAAAGACATAILGWYVRKPDRSARLGLSIFAVPVFVSGLSIGGLAGSFVAAGTAMLWLAPGREWFATGRWTPPTPPAEVEKKKGTALSPRTPPGAALHERAAGRGLPGSPGAASPWQHHQLHARPAAMVAAFVITVVMAGGLLTLSLLWIAIAGLSPEFLRSVLEQQPNMFDDGLTFDQVRDTVIAFASAFVVWCVVALVLAGFAMARRDWARRGLMIVAAFSAGGCLFFVLDAPFVILPAMAAVATVVCLRRVEVRRWFSLEPH